MAQRGTLQASKALKSGFGIQEGTVKVLEARFKIIQRTKKDGSLVTPFLAMEFDVTKVNEKYEPVDDQAAPDQADFLLAWGTKESNAEGKHLFYHRPGHVDSADSAEVKDLSLDPDVDQAPCDIDTEGNTFCSLKGGAPFADSDAALFMKSLEAAGWKPEVNDQAYAGNYVGAVFDVKTVNKEDLCKELGIRFNAPKEKNDQPPTIWKVTKIHVRPYENKGKAGKVAGKGTATSATTSAPASAGKTNGAASSAEVEVHVKEYLKLHKGKTLARSDFQKELGVYLMGKKVGMKEVQAFVKANVQSDEGLMGLGLANGFELVQDDDEKITSVTF